MSEKNDDVTVDSIINDMNDDFNDFISKVNNEFNMPLNVNDDVLPYLSPINKAESEATPIRLPSIPDEVTNTSTHNSSSKVPIIKSSSNVGKKSTFKYVDTMMLSIKLKTLLTHDEYYTIKHIISYNKNKAEQNELRARQYDAIIENLNRSEK